MSPRIVADGQRRLHDSPEYQARLCVLHDSIRAQYAAELAQAGFWRRMLLHWRIAMKFRKERRTIEPSPGSLYISRISEKRA